MSLRKQFLYVCEAWERYKNLENGYHLSWTTGRWKCDEPRAKCCFLGTKERVFCINWQREMDLFWESQTQKIMGRPRTTINIYRKTESLRRENNAVRLVGSEGYRVPWASGTRWNSWYRSLPSVNDRFEQCIDRKATRVGYETRKSDFAARQHPITHNENGQRYNFRNSCPTRRTFQTWHLPTTTCFHRCRTHFPRSTSAHMNKSGNGLRTGSSWKTTSFSGMASTNCQRDGKS